MLRTLTATVFFILMLGFGTAQGQAKDEDYANVKGRLNVWTTQEVMRNEAKRGERPEFLKLRFAKQEGFDRVVFELKGDIASYYIHYSKPPFQSEAGEETIKVHGQAFVEISLYPVGSSDENIEANAKVAREQRRPNLGAIQEVKQVEWFEGELRYVFGLDKRTPFRVQVLSNPLRVVVD